MLKFDSIALAKFFALREETGHSLETIGIDSLSPAHRAFMACDGTLTQLLSAVYLEDVVTDCELNDETIAGPDEQDWLQIGPEPCTRRQVSLIGGSSGRTYVRALSYLYRPRLPEHFLNDMAHDGASLGAQLHTSRVIHRRELISVRTGDDDYVFSRRYRILVPDRPAILIQEDFLRDIPS